MKTLALLAGFIASMSLAVSGQGFINLNFERAVVQLNNPQYGFLSWSQAVPGWSHSDGGDTSVVYYGSPHLGMSQCYLLEDSLSPTYAPGRQLAGNYSLAFASGIQNGADITSPWVNAYISQTGTIPVGTLSLRMLATGPLEVYVGGVEVPMYSVGGNKYAGDISGFAGTVAELKIVNTATAGDVQDYTVVDNIVFSPAAVPEPSSVMLVLLGIGLFAGCGRRFLW